MQSWKTIGPAIRQLLSKAQYCDRIRFWIVFEYETKEYTLVSLPDWPNTKELIARGEIRLVAGMTGDELTEAYKEFNRIQVRLFDDAGTPKSIPIGEQPGGRNSVLDGGATGDHRGESSGDNADAVSGIHGGADSSGDSGGGSGESA